MTTTEKHHAGALFSTKEAAKILGMSHPYVIMLCDSGKLGEIMFGDDGHRQIPSDALERYKTQMQDMYKDAPTMREAGIEAGLYDRDEEDWGTITKK